MNNTREKEYRFDIVTHKFLDNEFHVSFDRKPTIDELLDELANEIQRQCISWGVPQIGSVRMWEVVDIDHLKVGCNQLDESDQDLFWKWLKEEKK